MPFSPKSEEHLLNSGANIINISRTKSEAYFYFKDKKAAENFSQKKLYGAYRIANYERHKKGSKKEGALNLDKYAYKAVEKAEHNEDYWKVTISKDEYCMYMGQTYKKVGDPRFSEHGYNQHWLYYEKGTNEFDLLGEHIQGSSKKYYDLDEVRAAKAAEKANVSAPKKEGKQEAKTDERTPLLKATQPSNQSDPDDKSWDFATTHSNPRNELKNQPKQNVTPSAPSPSRDYSNDFLPTANPFAKPSAPPQSRDYSNDFHPKADPFAKPSAPPQSRDYTRDLLANAQTSSSTNPNTNSNNNLPYMQLLSNTQSSPLPQQNPATINPTLNNAYQALSNDISKSPDAGGFEEVESLIFKLTGVKTKRIRNAPGNSNNPTSALSKNCMVDFESKEDRDIVIEFLKQEGIFENSKENYKPQTEMSSQYAVLFYANIKFRTGEFAHTQFSLQEGLEKLLAHKIKETQDYKTQRNSFCEKLQYGLASCFSFFGCKNFSRTQKTTAAEHLLDRYQNGTKNTISDDDRAALNQGRLGNIASHAVKSSK